MQDPAPRRLANGGALPRLSDVSKYRDGVTLDAQATRPPQPADATWHGPGELTHLLVPLDTLEPLPGNPRRGDVDAVARSLQRFGQRKPVTYRPSDRTVTAGNHTRLAALQLGWTHLAAVPIEETDAEAKAWAVADNRTSDLATNDDEDLAAMLAEIAAVDASLMDAASYSSEDLAELLASLEPPRQPLVDADEVPVPPPVPVTQPGDLWLLGRHRLLCGDATSEADHERALAGAVADLVLTDPPYGVGLDYGPTMDDSSGTVASIVRAFMPLALRHRRALVCSGQQPMWDYPRPSWVLAWVHPAGGGSGPWGFTCLNPILAYGSDPYLERGLGSRPDVVVLAADRDGEDIAHPVVKPMDAWRWLLLRGSALEGDVVFDPFMGSGTTLVACELENRTAVGIEISPAYCDVIVERWEGVTGGKAEREEAARG